MFLMSTFIVISHLYLSPVPIAPVSKKARRIKGKKKKKTTCISFCFLTLFCSEIMLRMEYVLFCNRRSDFLKWDWG